MKKILGFGSIVLTLAVALLNGCSSSNTPATPAAPVTVIRLATATFTLSPTITTTPPPFTSTPTPIFTPPGSWTTIGSVDASWIRGMAVDPSDNVYIADGKVPGIVELIKAGGSATITSYAVSTPVPSMTPQLISPYDVTWAANPTPGLFVTDSQNTPYGLVGIPGGVYNPTNGTGLSTQLYGVAADQSTNCNGGPCLYVADYWNNRVVKLDQNDGAYVAETTVPQPYGVAVNSAGTTEVITYGSAGAGQIMEIGGGNVQVFDSYHWTTSTVNFYNPLYVALDSSGNIYVNDNNSGTTRIVELSPIGGTLAVYSNAFGINFNLAVGLAVDSSNNIYIDDSGNGGRVMKYVP